MKKDKSCGAVVYINNKGNNLFLLIKQKRHHDWVFPKGHVENGETETETALREIKEETGLDVYIHSDFRYVVNYVVDNDIDKDVVYFLAKPENTDVIRQEEEVDDYMWLDYKNALSTLSYENLRNVLTDANIYLNKYNLL